MEHYITAGELAILLALIWLPVFVLAALPQWLLLGARRKRFIWLLALLALECALAVAIWLSPLHQYFLPLFFLGGWSILAIPLQAAVLAALAATFLTWVAARGVPRPAP